MQIFENLKIRKIRK